MNILTALDALSETIVFPVHPRTRLIFQRMNYTPMAHVLLIDPVGYLDMVQLEQSARMILTDSGGIQKEAYWLSIPCVTLRDETEWVETVQAGWNVLVGAKAEAIIQAARSFEPPVIHEPLYGDGTTSGQIAQTFSALE
jgi:UDP-GlcNAc3NAcA epimerase